MRWEGWNDNARSLSDIGEADSASDRIPSNGAKRTRRKPGRSRSQPEGVKDGVLQAHSACTWYLSSSDDSLSDRLSSPISLSFM